MFKFILNRHTLRLCLISGANVLFIFFNDFIKCNVNFRFCYNCINCYTNNPFMLLRKGLLCVAQNFFNAKFGSLGIMLYLCSIIVTNDPNSEMIKQKTNEYE